MCARSPCNRRYVFAPKRPPTPHPPPPTLPPRTRTARRAGAPSGRAERAAQHARWPRSAGTSTRPAPPKKGRRGQLPRALHTHKQRATFRQLQKKPRLLHAHSLQPKKNHRGTMTCDPKKQTRRNAAAKPQGPNEVCCNNFALGPTAAAPTSSGTEAPVLPQGDRATRIASLLVRTRNGRAGPPSPCIPIALRNALQCKSNVASSVARATASRL